MDIGRIKKSVGKITYENADTNALVVIDSADFDTLANEINQCDNKVNDYITRMNAIYNNLNINPDTSAEDLENAFNLKKSGAVILNPNGTVKSQTGAATSINGSIVDSVAVDCSEANLTADNLSEGFKAYDASGNLITGTGVDNANYYNLGLTDGYARAINASNITYIYHVHTNTDGEETTYKSTQTPYNGPTKGSSSTVKGGCYQQWHEGHFTTHSHTSSCSNHEVVDCPGGPWDADGYGWDGCTRCGGPLNHPPYTHTVYDCGNYPLNAGWVAGYYSCTCGHSNGELMGSELSFE